MCIRDRVKKAHPGDAKEKHLISCVGSLTKNKQQHLLAEAFGLLAADHPDWNVEFWGYSGHYGSRIQSWADKHSLSGRILIKGQTTHVEDVYARSDIFCLPSRAEGWGLGLTAVSYTHLDVYKRQVPRSAYPGQPH